MTTDTKAVSVRFSSSSKTYDYLCTFPVRPGDRVIVETRRGDATVEVVAVKDYSDRATAYISRSAPVVGEGDAA